MNIRDFYSGISDFKKVYQSRTIIVRNEKVYLVAGSCSIMARWRNNFSQVLNIHGVNDVRQREIQTADPPVPEPSAFEVEMAIEKLKTHTSPGIYQITAEMIKVGGRTICSEIHKLINSVWNKVELPKQWKESIIVPICKGRKNRLQ